MCFIKLNNDNELIAILSLGDGLKPFRNTLFLFSFIILIFFILLNFYFAPIIYKQYKIQESELRNTLDFDNMVFSNFLNLNKTTILDFEKDNNEEEDFEIRVISEEGDVRQRFQMAADRSIVLSHPSYPCDMEVLSLSEIESKEK